MGNGNGKREWVIGIEDVNEVWGNYNWEENKIGRGKEFEK